MSCLHRHDIKAWSTVDAKTIPNGRQRFFSLLDTLIWPNSKAAFLLFLHRKANIAMRESSLKNLPKMVSTTKLQSQLQKYYPLQTINQLIKLDISHSHYIWTCSFMFIRVWNHWQNWYQQTLFVSPYEGIRKQRNRVKECEKQKQKMQSPIPVLGDRNAFCVTGQSRLFLQWTHCQITGLHSPFRAIKRLIIQTLWEQTTEYNFYLNAQFELKCISFFMLIYLFLSHLNGIVHPKINSTIPVPLIRRDNYM